MIPLGNWEETNDELRNEIASLEDERDSLQHDHDNLLHELGRLDDEVTDYLYEIDRLKDRNTELQVDIDGLLELVEYWQHKATGEREQNAFEVEAQLWRERAEKAEREIQELAAENLQLQREAQEEWERANTLETYSISIEESRELTTRNLELERKNSEVHSDFEDLKTGYNELYADYSKASYELTEIHGLVGYGIPEKTINLVRAMRDDLDELERENNDLADSYAQVVINNLELKKALRTLSE